MFQKHSIMSLKKKSKSLGHLTALGSYPCSPDVEPKVRRALKENVKPTVLILNPELWTYCLSFLNGPTRVKTTTFGYFPKKGVKRAEFVI